MQQAPKTVLVFGKTGQLARSLADLPLGDLILCFLGRDECDLTDASAISDVIRQRCPDVVVNAAAYTAVDKAESEEGLAYQVNAEAPESMAQACAGLGIGFIHISTDYVFDGEATEPYPVEHEVNPLGVYGASKLAGERKVLAALPSAVVIRTSWVYGDVGNNFVATMLRLTETRDSIGVVGDQWGLPTYASDLAMAILEVVSKLNTEQGGIYHYSNQGQPITWFDFVKEVFRCAGKEIEVNKLTTEQFPTPTKRPKWSVLDCTKIQKVYQLEIPQWQASLAEYFTKKTKLS